MTPQELPMEQPPQTASAAGFPAARKPLSRRASIIGAVVALLLVAGVGGLAWYLTRPAPAPLTGSPGGPGGGPGGPPGGGFGGGGRGASTVGVATAERTSIAVTLDALGTVTPLATVKVRPQVSGVLEKVLFKEGQMVRAGELLATLDARQFELALAQATGQRQRDMTQLESAKVTLARFQTLLSQDSIARQEVDSQSALVRQLEGTVMVNNAAVGVAQLNLSYTRITAPISGRVGLRTVDVGNTVSSSDANGVAVITQIMPVDVVFAVPQDRIGDVLGAAKQTCRYWQWTARARARWAAESFRRLTTRWTPPQARSKPRRALPTLTRLCLPTSLSTSSCASGRLTMRWWCLWQRCAWAAVGTLCLC